jgi:hypothetical protein
LLSGQQIFTLPLAVSMLQMAIHFRSSLHYLPDKFNFAFSIYVHHSRITPFAADSGLNSAPDSSYPILRQQLLQLVVDCIISTTAC